MTTTVMQIANEIATAHEVPPMRTATKASKHTARILGVDTLDVVADTELTDVQANALRTALSAEFGATVTKIGR